MLAMTSPRDKGDNSEKQMGEDRVGTVMLFGVPIVCLHIDNKERLCLAQISNTILRDFSYNEIHNRRVALGITCMQCSPSQLEILRRTGAMPVSSRRCGLITKREAERLVKSFIEDIPPPRLPEDFAFKVSHACGWGSKGLFMPSRYNSSRAKCIKCLTCDSYFSPNKFIFHYHKLAGGEYKHPDAANFNSWRRHLVLADDNPSETLMHAWEDVKAMFNGGCRKRFSSSSRSSSSSFMPRSEVADVGPTDSPFQRLGSNPYFGAFVPPTSRTHSAFPNPMLGRITSYGDFFRSLSLPYNNPWTGKLDFPQSPLNVPAHGGKPEQYGLPGHGSCLPLNIPYPAPRNWPDGHLLPTPSGMAPVSSSMTSMSALPSQPCFPEKVELANKRGVEPSNKREVEPESSTENTDLGSEEPSPAKKQRLTTTEPDSSIDVEKNDLDPGARFADNVTDESASDDKDVIDVETTDAKEEAKTTRKEPTEEDVTHMAAAEVDLDGSLDTEHLQLMPIDSLRNAVSKAVTQRKDAEKDHKKIQNMLRLRALKELELREEFARQFCSIKENLWSEIEQERTAKGALEEKLKETRQLLQRLSRHMPESVLLPSCK